MEGIPFLNVREIGKGSTWSHILHIKVGTCKHHASMSNIRRNFSEPFIPFFPIFYRMWIYDEKSSGCSFFLRCCYFIEINHCKYLIVGCQDKYFRYFNHLSLACLELKFLHFFNWKRHCIWILYSASSKEE